MDKLVVEGGKRLSGSVDIHGAKNSVLPILAAAFLCKGKSVILNCPNLSDVEAAIRILLYLGCHVRREGGSIIVDAESAQGYTIPDELMREMRSSIIFLGAVCARFNQAVLSFPGGCELGPRPIDLHVSALRQMGVDIKEEHGKLNCRVPSVLAGQKITLNFPSVGATENIMIAASVAKGETIIINAAQEPEISDLANFLRSCGARIWGDGGSLIRIEGVEALHGCEHTVIPDRIAAITFLSAAAITRGEIEVRKVVPDHIASVTNLFEQAGSAVKITRNSVYLAQTGRTLPFRSVATMPYPGFPTDAQSPIMAVAALSEGTSVFIENIFQNRYKHIEELIRLGAKIKSEGKMAVVEGVSRLTGAPVECTDLRGGAALVIATLAAEGTSEIYKIHHLDRGYEKIEESLKLLGANIERQ